MPITYVSGWALPTGRFHALTLEVSQKDQKFFNATAHLELSELPSVPDGKDCHEFYMSVQMSTQFWMFQSYPINYEAPFAPSEIQIDGRPALVMHAPSTMEFTVPEGATTMSGAFGFADGAYIGSGQTDGATFRILWKDRQQQVELYQRRLDPRNVPRGPGATGLPCRAPEICRRQVVVADRPWCA